MKDANNYFDDMGFNPHSLTGVIQRWNESRADAMFQSTLPYGSDSNINIVPKF